MGVIGAGEWEFDGFVYGERYTISVVVVTNLVFAFAAAVGGTLASTGDACLYRCGIGRWRWI